jgi:hypothetical protein
MKKEMNKSLHLSVIILNWNGWHDTICCIKSIQTQPYLYHDIIIVDNGSSDESTKKIIQYYQDFKNETGSNFIQSYHRNDYNPLLIYKKARNCIFLLKNSQNYGYARGNNIGIRFALDHLNPDYILILNNDVIFKEPDTVKILVQYMEKNPQIGLISPIIRSPDGTIQRTCTRSFPKFLDYIFVYSFIGQRLWKMNPFWKKHYNYKYSFDKPESFDILSGSFMLFRTMALQEIGLFDENTFLYWEEPIIGKKLTAAGWNSVLYPDFSVIHKGESSISNFNLKSWARYWSVQSEIYYLNEYEKMHKLKIGCIICTLMFECGIALLQAFIYGKRGNFDTVWERKIWKILIHELFR